MATEGDYFTPDAAQLVYKDAQRWYGIYGAEKKLAFFVGPGPHGMPLETREHIYQWMIRWLKDGQGDYHELPVHQYTNFQLLVTPTGRVADLPGSRKLYQIIRDDLRAKTKPGTTAELTAELTQLGVPSPGTAPNVEVLDESAGDGYRVQHIRLESDPGVEIEGRIYIPAAPANRRAMLVVSDTLRSPWIPSTDSIAERIAKAGQVVLTLEVRDDPSGFDHRIDLGNWMAFTRADHIGLNLPAMRAHDILRGVDVLAARSDVDPAKIHVTARGVKGMWVLMAAVVGPRISKVWLDRTPYSIREALDTPLNSGLFDGVIPGFALHWDIDDFVKAMGKRPVMWTDPTNWMNRLVILPAPFQYRYVLGDTTDFNDQQDNKYISQFIE